MLAFNQTQYRLLKQTDQLTKRCMLALNQTQYRLLKQTDQLTQRCTLALNQTQYRLLKQTDQLTQPVGSHQFLGPQSEASARRPSDAFRHWNVPLLPPRRGQWPA